MEAKTRALRKAHQASLQLAKARDLMLEAAALTADGSIGNGDYLHWAHQIGELLSTDNGEAGIGPGLTLLAKSIPQPPKPMTYPHRRADGTIVNVSIPED